MLLIVVTSLLFASIDPKAALAFQGMEIESAAESCGEGARRDNQSIEVAVWGNQRS